MEAEIIVEYLPQLGVCNLCLNEGAVESMILAHKHDGKTEIYTEMLMKCFSIDISQMELGDTKQMICDRCIAKLRECTDFKKQVEDALSYLENTIKLQKECIKSEDGDTVVNHAHNDLHEDFTVDDHSDEDDCIKSEDGDTEANHAHNVLHVDFPDDDHGDEDFKISIKNEENVIVKSKKSIKKKLRYIKLTKKYKDINETEAMLSHGLFPFKIWKNRTFCCSICPEKCATLEEMKSHVCQHSKTIIHTAFNKMMFSKSHRFYKSSTNLRCKICTADTANFEELKLHIENCTRLIYASKKWSNLPFKLEKDQLDCPICKKRFLNFVSLNTHMNVHYPNYICENCGKAFASKARLRGHMRTHEEGQFPCKYCEAVFDRVTKRENHVSKEHKSGVRYACKRCNIPLTSFYARQKHLAEVHNEELKRYKCKACPQSYITPGHLSSHVRRDHLNERNHKCDKCDLAFYTKNALKMHMIKHDGERIHVCNVCQKSYQRKKTLREHMRIHDNDKRFVCPVCGRAFTQKCTLKGHLRVHERKLDIDDRVVQPLHSI